MNDSLTKRSMVLALAVSIIFALSRTVTIISRNLMVPTHAAIGFSDYPHSLESHRRAASLKLKRRKTPAFTDIARLHGLSLNSNFQTFHGAFTGHVTCTNQPCAATMRITLASTNNPNLVRVFQTDADGSFHIDLTFSEIPHEQIDWKLSALRGSVINSEAHGRRLLMENATLAVDQSFNFR